MYQLDMSKEKAAEYASRIVSAAQSGRIYDVELEIKYINDEIVRSLVDQGSNKVNAQEIARSYLDILLVTIRASGNLP